MLSDNIVLLFEIMNFQLRRKRLNSFSSSVGQSTQESQPELKLPVLSNIALHACAVFFDVNGTILNSSQLGFELSNRLLRKNGYPIIDFEMYLYSTRYPTAKRFAWYITGNLEDKSGVGEAIAEQYDDQYADAVNSDNAALYPGLERALSQVKVDILNVKFGALTNECGDFCRNVLKCNQVNNLFLIGLGADDVPAPKPSGTGLIKCANLLGLPVKHCIYVGDSPIDGIAAMNAGMTSVGVTYGSCPSCINSLYFEHLVDTPAQLRRLLVKLLNDINSDIADATTNATSTSSSASNVLGLSDSETDVCTHAELFVANTVGQLQISSQPNQHSYA